jgi:hypothetical protein
MQSFRTADKMAATQLEAHPESHFPQNHTSEQQKNSLPYILRFLVNRPKF